MVSVFLQYFARGARLGKIETATHAQRLTVVFPKPIFPRLKRKRLFKIKSRENKTQWNHANAYLRKIFNCFEVQSLLLHYL